MITNEGPGRRQVTRYRAYKLFRKTMLIVYVALFVLPLLMFNIYGSLLRITVIAFREGGISSNGFPRGVLPREGRISEFSFNDPIYHNRLGYNVLDDRVAVCSYHGYFFKKIEYVSPEDGNFTSYPSSHGHLTLLGQLIQVGDVTIFRDEALGFQQYRQEYRTMHYDAGTGDIPIVITDKSIIENGEPVMYRNAGSSVVFGRFYTNYGRIRIGEDEYQPIRDTTFIDVEKTVIF